MEIIFNNVYASIYMDKKNTRVLKVFKSVPMYDTEKYYLLKLSSTQGLQGCVPKVLDCDDRKKHILMEHIGYDGIELTNAKLFTGTTWDTYLIQVSNILNTLVRNGLSHRDIKPENAVYNTETKTWALIDFAFMENSQSPVSIKHFKGTFPYAAPFLGNRNMLTQFLQYNEASDIKIAADYYAFALSALSLYGMDHTTMGKSVQLDLNFIYDIIRNDNHTMLYALAIVVISCIDVTKTMAVWSNSDKSCMFYGNIQYPLPIQPERNVTKCWNKLMSIIENRKFITRDVQTENKHDEH
jgi:serine/threonine protein kinase